MVVQSGLGSRSPGSWPKAQWRPPPDLSIASLGLGKAQSVLQENVEQRAHRQSLRCDPVICPLEFPNVPGYIELVGS